MKTVLAIAVIAIGLAGCSDGEEARKALRGAGYTDVQITGWKLLGCDKGDSYTTGFEAKGPTGVQVSGVVCSGVFKGATIRTE